MLLFDFMNPWITYIGVFVAFIFSVWAIFNKKDFISRHKNKMIITAMILLIWTQFARYAGVFFTDDVHWSIGIFNFRIIAFNLGSHLPFYICRLSVIVLLYYTITRDKRVESFLFFWGATGLAGVLYPNSNEIYDIFKLTETFYIDHFLLAITPFFLVVYQGYRPSLKDARNIAIVMFVILTLFIPINNLFNHLGVVGLEGKPVDYFYVNDQSVLSVITSSLYEKDYISFEKLPSIVFVLIHSVAAYGFFSIYYNIFKNKEFEV